MNKLLNFEINSVNASTCIKIEDLPSGEVPPQGPQPAELSSLNFCIPTKEKIVYILYFKHYMPRLRYQIENLRLKLGDYCEQNQDACF